MPTLVKSKYGGLVPADHPDADLTSGPQDPNQQPNQTSNISPAPPPPASTTAPAPAPGSQPPEGLAGWVSVPGGGWVPPNHPLAQSAGAVPSVAAAAAGGQPAATPATIQDVYRQTLLGLLQGPTPAQAAAQADTSPAAAAFRIQSQRGADRQRRQLAATAGAEGWAGSGAMETGQNAIAQQAAESQAGFVGQLSQQLMQDRRNELLQALGMAQQMGQFDQAQALQRELAQLDAQLRREGYGVTTAGQGIQRELGLGDLDLRRMLGLAGLDLQRYGIDVGNQQAQNQLGYNYTALQSGVNDRIIDRLLNPENYA